MGAAKSWAQQSFERLVREHLSPLLKQHGYKKVGLTWRIRREEPPRAWGVVNVQKSRWCTRDDITFTVNLGVYWDGAPVPVRDPVGAQGPAESCCQVRERIGLLQDRPADRWWEIDGGQWSPGEGPDCLRPIVRSLMPLLEQRGLLWIERRLNNRGLAAYTRKFRTGNMGQSLDDSDLDGTE
jgi:hypothetical protein